jgi:hypothetical protein
MSIIHYRRAALPTEDMALSGNIKEHTMRRLTVLYAPDGMAGAGRYTERFDDGLVHNHHWAVTTDEEYPSYNEGPAIEGIRTWVTTGTSFPGGRVHAAQTDRDDGLVHNHEWATSGK